MCRCGGRWKKEGRGRGETKRGSARPRGTQGHSCPTELLQYEVAVPLERAGDCLLEVSFRTIMKFYTCKHNRSGMERRLGRFAAPPNRRA